MVSGPRSFLEGIPQASVLSWGDPCQACSWRGVTPVRPVKGTPEQDRGYHTGQDSGYSPDRTGGTPPPPPGGQATPRDVRLLKS